MRRVEASSSDRAVGGRPGGLVAVGFALVVVASAAVAGGVATAQPGAAAPGTGTADAEPSNGTIGTNATVDAANGTVTPEAGTTGQIGVVVETRVDGRWRPVTTADDGVTVDVTYVNTRETVVDDGRLLFDGVYQLWGVKPGRYRVEVNAAGTAFRSATESVVLDDGEVRTVTMRLEGRPASAVGQVHNGSGTRLPGTTVLLDRAGDDELDPVARTTTDGTGFYAFENVTPGVDYRVVARLAGERTERSLGVLDGGEGAESLLVVPNATRTTTLRVTGPSNASAHRATVRTPGSEVVAVDGLTGDERVVDGGVGGTTATVAGNVTPAADGTLFAVTVRGNVTGDEADLYVDRVDGDPNPPNRSSVTLVSRGRTLDRGADGVFATGIPGVSTRTPLDVDGDGATEDVDGSGSLTLADAIELLFVDARVVDTPRRVAALDFDDDGGFDVTDVVSLLYEVLSPS